MCNSVYIFAVGEEIFNSARFLFTDQLRGWNMYVAICESFVASYSLHQFHYMCILALDRIIFCHDFIRE